MLLLFPLQINELPRGTVAKAKLWILESVALRVVKGQDSAVDVERRAKPRGTPSVVLNTVGRKRVEQN